MRQGRCHQGPWPQRGKRRSRLPLHVRQSSSPSNPAHSRRRRRGKGLRVGGNFSTAKRRTKGRLWLVVEAGAADGMSLRVERIIVRREQRHAAVLRDKHL